MHCLYVIYSQSIDRYYVGESPNAIDRLKQLNEHYFRKGFTKAAEDWKIVLARECDSKEDAVYLERFIKRMKSKRFIRKIVRKPEILNDILSKR